MRRFVNNFYIRKIINFIRVLQLEKRFYIRKNEGINEKYSQEKDVIFCANGFLPHGGIADRMYGILTTYALCKINKLRFAINFTTPYKLENFFTPNKYNWQISENDVCYNLKYSKPVLLMGGCKKISFNTIRKENRTLHVYSNYKGLDVINDSFNTMFTWKELFNELFTLNDNFCIDLFKIKNVLPQKYVSLQIRILNALGDFCDCGSKELSETKKSELLEICKQKVYSLYADKKIPILLTSDSQRLIDSLQSSCKEMLFVIPGNITHSDNKDISGYEAHKKTFIDLFCLADGKEIYQISSQYIYCSGFSMLASQIKGKEIQWI